MSEEPEEEPAGEPPFSPAELSSASVTARLPAPPMHALDALKARLARASELFAAVPSRAACPALLFRSGDGTVECCPIDEETVVGRGADCAIRFEGRQEISRRHFAVREEEGLFILEDLGSSNGTRVEGNDEPVARRELRDGDLIHAGGVVFLFVKE